MPHSMKMSCWTVPSHCDCIFFLALSGSGIFLYYKNFNASDKTNPGEIFPGIIIIISFEHDENVCIFSVS